MEMTDFIEKLNNLRWEPSFSSQRGLVFSGIDPGSQRCLGELHPHGLAIKDCPSYLQSAEIRTWAAQFYDQLQATFELDLLAQVFKPAIEVLPAVAPLPAFTQVLIRSYVTAAPSLSTARTGLRHIMRSCEVEETVAAAVWHMLGGYSDT